ncbi:MAG: M20 family metallopeptidase [Ilumatobacteraceae bacterium]|nr:M20 family metallopeptidase [Ilumatobacteraceae bacterium]
MTLGIDDHRTAAQVRATLDAQQPAMVADLERFVNIESPSLEHECLARSAQFLADLMTRVLGSPPVLVASDRGPHVHWKGSDDTKVLIVGHHDTVFPLGTVARRPFTREGNIGRGPGIFDMKAGIIQAIYGVAAVKEWCQVEMLITADEEVGSHASRALLEERARATGAVLVLEPSADGGALKIARKGTGTFNVTITGRASHAGLEPEKGINALVELAAQVPRIVAIARPDLGTTVTPTVAKAGTADNVVPASATIAVDVRCVIPEEKNRLEAEMSRLTATLAGARVEVSGGMNRPPMHESMTKELFAIAQKVADDYGITGLRGVAVGGGSDGNLTAAVGVRTLDGLGAVGAGAHAETEHVQLDAMPERAALIAGLVQSIVNG